MSALHSLVGIKKGDLNSVYHLRRVEWERKDVLASHFQTFCHQVCSHLEIRWSKRGVRYGGRTGIQCSKGHTLRDKDNNSKTVIHTAHLTAVYGVLETTLQTLVMVRVEVTKKVPLASWDGPIAESIHSETST